MQRPCLVWGRLCGCVLLVGLGWSTVVAEPETKPATAPSTAVDTETEKPGRLPAPFGMLGLSPRQREQILSVQGEFDPRIAQLKKEIQQLTAERQQKMEEHLTPGQKTRLAEIQAQAAAAKQKKEKASP